MNALPTPGVSLAKLTTILSEQSANIIEVNHERLCRWLSAKAAVLAIMIELADAASDDRLISAFSDAGFDAKPGNPNRPGGFGSRPLCTTRLPGRSDPARMFPRIDRCR